MASLSLVFSDLYTEVEKSLGTYNSGSAAAGDVTDAKFITNRAYARFCSYYDWTFLNQEKNLTTVDGTYRYELPADFSYFILPRLTYAGDDAYAPVEQRSTSQIMNMRAESVYENYPMYFALQAGSYHKESGQTWDVLVYPTADTSYTLTYYCKINPLKLENDADIPIGGPETSDCLLELCLAYASAYKDDKRSVHSEIVNEVLGPAKMMDSRRRTNTLGSLNVGSGVIDFNEVHHGNVLIST